MYAYLEGNLTYKSPALLHLATAGVGYEVHISLRTYEKIQHLEAVRLYTHLQVREDAWTLYGFADEAERVTFRSLISVNGVGATTATLVLSAMSPDELERAVATDDHRALGRVKGIGPKTAQRMVLELKGKLVPGTGTTGGVKQDSWHNTVEDDALIALVNLGIARSVAESAVKKVPDASSMTVEALLKEALRNL
jgi:Holliday junction DNA helicase RuvA